MDKKLTVIFEYDKKRVMMCEKAYLAGEADIRQWGQSIGQLMNNSMRLHFEPFIKETSDILEENGKQYRHYTALFTLEVLPTDFKKYYEAGQYLIWRCAVESEGKTIAIGTHEEGSGEQDLE